MRPRPAPFALRFLVVVALSLAGIAWVWGNPPRGAPDELTHYIKALGVGGGELGGHSPSKRRDASLNQEDYANLAALIRAAQANGRADRPTGREAVRLAWMSRQTRRFSIPAGLAVNALCPSTGVRRATCLDDIRGSPSATAAATPMGTYMPLPYVLPGLAARAGGDPITAIRLGRVTSAVLCLGLIALAAAAIWDGRRGGAVALLGLVAALSPAVLLLATAINPSGPEIAGAMAFAAGLLAVTRPGGRAWSAWTAVGVGGACLAGSRSFGPLFVVLTVVTIAVLTGRRGVRAAIAPPRAPAIVTAGLVAVAAVLNWAWEFTRQPHPGLGLDDVRPGISDAVDGLPSLGQQVVGVFGSGLDVLMPTPVYLAWAVLVVGVVALAAVVGDRREKAVLGGSILVVLGLVIVLSIAVRPTGFSIQARHLLPAVVLLPLVAGEVLRRHADELSWRTVRTTLLGAITIAAAVHLAAWYLNARAWSLGATGPDFLISDAGWSPPGSWIPWVVAVVCAATASFAAVYVAVRATVPRPSGPNVGPRRPTARRRHTSHLG